MDHVAAFVSVSTLDEIASECTGVEEGSRDTGCAIWVAHDVWSSAIETDRPAAVIICTIHERIGHREIVPGRSRRDAGDLPIPNQLVQNAAGISAKCLASTERKVVGIADHEGRGK